MEWSTSGLPYKKMLTIENFLLKGWIGMSKKIVIGVGVGIVGVIAVVAGIITFKKRREDNFVEDEYDFEDDFDSDEFEYFEDDDDHDKSGIDSFDTKKRRTTKDVGDMHIMRMKHNNFSAGSTFRVNRVNLPAKEATNQSVPDLDLVENDMSQIKVELDETAKDSSSCVTELAEAIDKKGYEVSNFNREQISALHYALKRNWKIDEAINPAYDSDQIVTIVTGIKNGYDPKYFANPELNHKQMLRIIQGLGCNVDVTKYNMSKYSDHQMTSILVGLMAGIEIDKLFNDNKLVNLDNQDVMRDLIFNKIASDGKDPNKYLNDLKY